MFVFELRTQENTCVFYRQNICSVIFQIQSKCEILKKIHFYFHQIEQTSSHPFENLIHPSTLALISNKGSESWTVCTYVVGNSLSNSIDTQTEFNTTSKHFTPSTDNDTKSIFLSVIRTFFKDSFFCSKTAKDKFKLKIVSQILIYIIHQR